MSHLSVHSLPDIAAAAMQDCVFPLWQQGIVGAITGVFALQAQHEVLSQLKAGELDIVISTAVAEEGLDVKQCQLVIRFDLPSTLLAFVQSR